MDETRWIDRWHRLGKWRWALVAVIVIGISAVVGALVWGGDGEDTTTTAGSGTATTAERSTTTVQSTTTSPSVSSTLTTAPATTTTAPSSTSTTARQITVPGIPSGVSARTGGGSGEVVLDWNAVPGAAGYRVLRSSSAGGPFGVVADVNVTIGATTAADDVVNIWSRQHSYVPQRGRLDGPDRSASFQYVDVGGPGQRCYEVVAYNGAGAGPASAVACGSPPS
jgi:hypothetical protein